MFQLQTQATKGRPVIDKKSQTWRSLRMLLCSGSRILITVMVAVLTKITNHQIPMVVILDFLMTDYKHSIYMN